jgi:hypothetical protein
VGIAERRATLLAQVDGAEDPLERDMFERRNLLHVHAGPDRAAGVVEHLGGHGTENESPEQAVAMSRKHDESRAGPFGSGSPEATSRLTSKYFNSAARYPSSWPTARPEP